MFPPTAGLTLLTRIIGQEEENKVGLEIIQKLLEEQFFSNKLYNCLTSQGLDQQTVFLLILHIINQFISADFHFSRLHSLDNIVSQLHFSECSFWLPRLWLTKLQG